MNIPNINDYPGGLSPPPGLPQRLRVSSTSLLFIAILYALLGWLGLALALPPGYASPVFPASGFALAVALHFGLKVLPAIWLGSLSLYIGVSLINGNLSATTLMVAAGISTGALLQAWVGRYLVQRWSAAKWRELHHERDALLLLGLGGGLAGLITATFGASSLVIAGMVPPASFGYSWWNWYVGDALGVFTTAPLVLGLLQRHQASWQARLKTIVIPVLGMLVMAVLLFSGAARWEIATQQARIGDQGGFLANALEDRFIAHREVLASLARLIEITPDLGLAQFDHFTKTTLRDQPDLFALSFNPYVTLDQRPELERRMAKVYPEGKFLITERDARGRLVGAGARPEYVPVGYISPLEGNRPAIGFDINSEPTRQEAISRARQSGQAAATAPIRLVQEQQERAGVLVLTPAFKPAADLGSNPAQRELIGFAVAVIKVDEMVDIAIKEILEPGLVVEILDPAADETRRLLYRSDSKSNAAAIGPVARMRLMMADREWTLRVLPTEAYLQAHRPWLAWGVGGIGLLFVALLQVLMLGVTGRSALIQRRVEEQTDEIHAKNAALAASEARYRQVAEIAQEALWDADMRTGRVGHNRRWIEMLGLGDDRLEHPVAFYFERIHPDDQARIHAAFERAVREDVDYEGIYRLRHEDGHYLWVEDRGRIVSRTAGGQPLRVLGAFTDVSERVRDQAALKESHARLDLSLEVARLSTFVHQLGSGEIQPDDRMLATLGIPPEERGNSLSFDEYLHRYVHPEDRAGFAARVGQLIAEGMELQHEYRLMRRDGAVIDVQSRVRVFRDAAGQPLQVLGVIQDVTQRKRRERLAQQLAAIVHSSTDAIIGENTDGIVTSWNRAAERIFGFTAGEMLGQPISRLVPPTLAGEEAGILARIRAGEPVPYFETRRVRKNGHAIEVGVTLSPVRDDQGTIVGASKIARDIAERKQMERTNAVLREMLDRSPDFVGFTGASLRIEYLNRGGRRLVGMADEVDVRQLSIGQFHPPAAFQQIAERIIPEIMARTGFWRGETTLLASDGREIPVDQQIFRLEGEGGQPGLFGTIMRDLTAQKTYERRLLDQQAELAESEQRFRTMADSAPVLIWVAGPDKLCHWFNKVWLDFTGRTLAQELGNGWAEGVHPDDFDRCLDIYISHFDRREPFVMDYRLRRHDGQYRWIHDAGTPCHDANQHFVGYIGSCIDITERIELEMALTEKEHFLRALIDIIPGMVGYWDADLRCGFANMAYLEWFGRTPEQMAGIRMQDLLGEALFQQNAPLIHAALAGDAQHFERTLTKVDGSTGYIWSHYLPNIVAGEVQGIFVLGSDVTELKVTQLQLEASNAALEQRTHEAESASRAKSEFLAQMSHEIRTPLNGVLGLAQVLSREPLSASQHDMIQRIQEAGQSLLGIINDILDFSKIEAGQLQLAPRPFRLETLTAKLASLFGATAAAKGLALRIEPPAKALGPLRGDALRLEQILINLTGNALKFTEQGGVAVRTRTLGSLDHEVRLRFEVQDTGIGISPAVQATLFTPFTQGDSGITRRFGGTGLGLSISKRLVELMGGEIGVDSQPGRGSTFWFELPFARASEAEEVSLAAPAAAPTGPRLRGLRLLAVDDSAMNRDLVERMLRMEGAEVTLAADGQQAVQYLHATTPGFDAVLMDVRMPVMDGLTAMRLIRHQLGMKELPILALTAGVLPEEQQAARDAGANEVLAKPLDLELLVTRLEHRIGAARLATAAAVPAVETEAGQVATRPAGSSGGGAPLTTGLASPADYPDIPGIDRERVALTFKDDVDFFLELLRRMTQEAAASLAQARQALANGDRETAARCLHSLKGNAGNLGALTLMASAGQVEASLKAGATDLKTGLDDLERQVADLTAASAQWLPTRARGLKAAAQDKPSPPLDERQLADLRDALRRQRLQARPLFKELEAGLVAAHGQERIRPLGEAISALRFDIALELLAQVAPEAPPMPPSDPSTAPGAGDLV